MHIYNAQKFLYNFNMAYDTTHIKKILDVVPSSDKKDYANLYKTFLRIANKTTEITFDEAVEFVRLIASTRMSEIGLKEARICFVDNLPQRTKGLFDSESWQIFLPTTIFQNLWQIKDGNRLSFEKKIENLIADINTTIHEFDHQEYETFTQGKISLGATKYLSKEEYRSSRLDRLKEGILKHKGKHFTAVKSMQDPSFEDNFSQLKYAKYFSSSYETRARESGSRYVLRLITNTKQYINTHPVEAIKLGLEFNKDGNFESLGTLLTEIVATGQCIPSKDDLRSEGVYESVQPTRPIYLAVSKFQKEYFERLPEKEANIIDLHRTMISPGATTQDRVAYRDSIEERVLFENSFALVQDDHMAHQIVQMDGIDPSLKTTALLYSNADVTFEEVARIYADERTYKESEHTIGHFLLRNPSNFVEYDSKQISDIRTFIYSEDNFLEQGQ